MRQHRCGTELGKESARCGSAARGHLHRGGRSLDARRLGDTARLHAGVAPTLLRRRFPFATWLDTDRCTHRTGCHRQQRELAWVGLDVQADALLWGGGGGPSSSLRRSQSLLFDRVTVSYTALNLACTRPTVCWCPHVAFLFSSPARRNRGAAVPLPTCLKAAFRAPDIDCRFVAGRHEEV